MASYADNSTALCEDTPFYRPIYARVAAVAAVSGFVSLVASCFVIFVIIFFKKWRFFTQRLILYLAIVAAIESSATILQRVDYENQVSDFYNGFCIFGGFYSQVTSWMGLNVIITITVSLLVTAFSNKPPEKYEPLFLVLIFLVPFTFNWIPFIKQTYGRAGPWCWIRSVDPVTCERFRFGQVLQFTLFYVPLYVVLLVLMIMYGIVLVKVHRNTKKWKFNPNADRLRKVTTRQIIPLILFPLIYFLLYLPLVINRVYDFIDPDNPKPALWFIAAVLFPLEGGGVAIVFTLDPKTRRRLRAVNIRAALTYFGSSSSSSKVEEYPMRNVEAEVRLNELLLVEQSKTMESA